MAVPEGYDLLGRIGFVDKGNYASGTTYLIGDVVYYNGSTWVALKDNLKGVTPTNGANWKYMARGFAAELLKDVKATDTSGLKGTAGAQVDAQALMDVIADKVATKLLLKSDVVSQIVNDATKAASMAALYAVNQKIGDVANLPNGAADVVTAIAQQNSNIGQIKLYSETMELNTSGYVDLPISDYESYKSDGYTGYVIMGYVFATGTISNAIHNIVQSNGVVRINYANSTPGSQPVRACILWRK